MSNIPTPDTQTAARLPNGALRTEVASLIVAALNLEIQPGEIAADEPLYGEGLGRITDR